MLGAVHHGAEQDADHSAERGENQRDAGRLRGEFHYLLQNENGLADAQIFCHQMCGQGRNHAGHQGGIIHDAHGADLHGEDGGRQRRAEERGKGCTHAAHDHPAPFVLTEAEELSETCAQRAAHLQGSALTADGAAEEMGHHRGQDNERRHAKGNLFPFTDGGEHQIGALGLLCPQRPVIEHDQETCDGQQKNDFSVRRAEGGGQNDALGKKRCHSADDQAAEAAEKNPFDAHQKRVPYMVTVCFYVHDQSAFSTVTEVMMTFSRGASCQPVFTEAMRSTSSRPSITLPKAAYWPSR